MSFLSPSAIKFFAEVKENEGPSYGQKVKYGFFPDFSTPTMLFFGTRQALCSLKDVLLSLNDQQEIKLENDSRFLSMRGTEILVSITDKKKGGMFNVVKGKPVFKWVVAKKDVESLVGLLSGVIDTEGSGHNYLGGELDDVEVVVSTGEYPDT